MGTNGYTNDRKRHDYRGKRGNDPCILICSLPKQNEQSKRASEEGVEGLGSEM